MATGRFEGIDREGDENLALIDSDERLPWLEADEDAVDDRGYATSRIILLGVLSLVLIGAVVGAAWFFLGGRAGEPPADGSLIAAPEEPYKSRPDDPGGKTFAGTGDTSFAVGEGQTREGKLADRPQGDAAAARPSLATTLGTDDAAPAADAPASVPTPGPPASSPSGVAVQVGAFPRRADAEEAWARLLRQTEALNGVRHRVVEAQVDIGRVYRLQAITSDRSAANALCGRLKADGLPCFVK